jgi:LssY C-terminus
VDSVDLDLSPSATRRRAKWRRWSTIAAAIVVAYATIAYVLLPLAWTHYAHQRKLQGFSMTTVTSEGFPGDPLNVGLVGGEADVVCAMHAAGWSPADPITPASSLKIIGSVVFDRPYVDAPVSNLFYLGRKEDLAFQKPHGNSADQRDHVRLWKVLDSGGEDRPVWLGSAAYDRGVGLSRYTGEVTHKIGADVDAERDRLIGDLVKAQVVEATYDVTGIGPTLNGRNGDGFPYYTDGEIHFARLVPDCRKRSEPPVALADPPIVNLKDAIWHGVEGALTK